MSSSELSFLARHVNSEKESRSCLVALPAPPAPPAVRLVNKLRPFYPPPLSRPFLHHPSPPTPTPTPKHTTHTHHEYLSQPQHYHHHLPREQGHHHASTLHRLLVPLGSELACRRGRIRRQVVALRHRRTLLQQHRRPESPRQHCSHDRE